MIDKDRIFWETIYRALTMAAAAIKARYLTEKPKTAQIQPDMIHSSH